MPRWGQAARSAKGRPSRSRPRSKGTSSSIAFVMRLRWRCSDGKARYQNPNNISESGVWRWKSSGMGDTAAYYKARADSRVRNLPHIHVRRRSLTPVRARRTIGSARTLPISAGQDGGDYENSNAPTSIGFRHHGCGARAKHHYGERELHRFWRDYCLRRDGREVDRVAVQRDLPELPGSEGGEVPDGATAEESWHVR